MLRATNLILPLLLVLSLAAATSTAQTPLVTRVVPEIGEPGDVISLEGFNMGTTTAVRFTASTSLGSQIINVAPSSITTTKVTVVVPAYTTFVSTNSAAGNVRCVAGAALSNFRAFFFLEQTAGQTTTEGNGSTLSTGGRPVVSFDIAGGAPTGGNGAFNYDESAVYGNMFSSTLPLTSNDPPFFAYVCREDALAHPKIGMCPSDGGKNWIDKRLCDNAPNTCGLIDLGRCPTDGGCIQHSANPQHWACLEGDGAGTYFGPYHMETVGVELYTALTPSECDN